MLIVMQAHATEEQVRAVCERIETLGYRAHAIPGAQRTAIGITGNQGEVEAGGLEEMPGVGEVIRVTKPYKLVSRDLKEEDTVCDIGSNDGELLSHYDAGTYNLVGFEPAVELAAESRKRLSPTANIFAEYFERKHWNKPDSLKIITAIAMFYDLEDPNTFLRDVKFLLHPEGVFVVQMNYLGLMLRNMTFDNISHEHLCYYSLETLIRLFDSNGLKIIHVETNDVNGGSLRIFASKNMEAFADPSVEWKRAEDRRLVTPVTLQNFVERVDTTKRLLMDFLVHLKKAGKKVYVYGASTRGLTLLQTIFNGQHATDYLVAAAERDAHKFGRYMVGVRIPIIPEEEARGEADYFLLLPYHFWLSIRDREWQWMVRGGKFIIPLPYPRVMTMAEIGDAVVPMAFTLDEDLEKVQV